MKKIEVIGNFIGFIFLIFGLIWITLEKMFCRKICMICNYEQISPCIFLFIFVGIIFIVSGASLLILENIAPELTL